VTRRPTPPPLTKTERTHLDDLIRRGARALNPTEANRLLRLLELDHADRQQERRTAGGLMAQVQQLGGQLKDMTVRAEQAEATIAAVRALHHDDYGLCHACTTSHGIPWPCPTITAIDSPTTPGVVKAMPLVPVSQEDIEDWALGTQTDPTAS